MQKIMLSHKERFAKNSRKQLDSTAQKHLLKT